MTAVERHEGGDQGGEGVGDARGARHLRDEALVAAVDERVARGVLRVEVGVVREVIDLSFSLLYPV